MNVTETVKQILKKNLKIVKISVNKKNILNNVKNIVSKMKQYRDADKIINIMMKINKKKIYTVINIVINSV